jgi:hypothetical protein
MGHEELKEIWVELCFHLSDNLNPNITENMFEQKVLLALEKLLGWSQFKGEIKVKPSFQIGRNNSITPDIVLYSTDNKAVAVLEIKRPSEDLSHMRSFGQLQSYMRQTKADFGLLLGKEIHVYYDGAKNPNANPLFMSRISFKSDSAEGIKFVEIFNRNSFIAREYESYLNKHIDQLVRKQKILTMMEELKSEETEKKILKFLQNEFRDEEKQIFMEATKGITIKISYQQNNGKQPVSTPPSEGPQETISVCQNKSSGKHFIYHLSYLS